MGSSRQGRPVRVPGNAAAFRGRPSSGLPQVDGQGVIVTVPDASLFAPES